MSDKVGSLVRLYLFVMKTIYFLVQATVYKNKVY